MGGLGRSIGILLTLVGFVYSILVLEHVVHTENYLATAGLSIAAGIFGLFILVATKGQHTPLKTPHNGICGFCGTGVNQDFSTCPACGAMWERAFKNPEGFKGAVRLFSIIFGWIGLMLSLLLLAYYFQFGSQAFAPWGELGMLGTLVFFALLLIGHYYLRPSIVGIWRRRFGRAY